MKIIIEGRSIDTLEIWDIQLVMKSQKVEIVIRITDKHDITIGRKIPYETYESEFSGIYAPYKKLYKELKEKWEADKSDTPIFKL